MIAGGVAIAVAACGLWVLAPRVEARQQRAARVLPEPIRRIAAPTFNGRPFLARLIAVLWLASGLSLAVAGLLGS